MILSKQNMNPRVGFEQLTSLLEIELHSSLKTKVKIQ